MTSDISESGDVLVLSDPDGNIYAIPRPVVEHHRLTPSQKAELEQQLGEDVSGFQLQSAYMTEKLAGYRHAELINEGNHARMARMAQASGDSAGGDQVGQTARPGFQSAITGVWRSIASLRTASS